MNPLPLLSGLITGTVIMHVVDRFSEATWSPRVVVVVGLLGGLGLAAEIVCLTWRLSRLHPPARVATGLELRPRAEPAPPGVPVARKATSFPEKGSQTEPAAPFALPLEPPVTAAPAVSREERAREVKEPPASSPPDPPPASLEEKPTRLELAAQLERLTAIWDLYRVQGSGLFSARGLQRQLDQGGLSGEVLAGDNLGLSDSVAAVDLKDEWGRLFLVPSFTRSTLAVADWFDATSSDARAGLVRRLLRPAIVGRSAEGWQCIRRGAVE